MVGGFLEISIYIILSNTTDGFNVYKWIENSDFCDADYGAEVVCSEAEEEEGMGFLGVGMWVRVENL